MRHHTRTRARLPGVALTCALVLAACGSQSSEQAPGDSAVASDQPSATDPAQATAEPPTSEIPDDFPLSAGMGGPEDTIATLRTGTGLRDLELCGTAPLRGLGSRDRMIADNSGGESANTRELLVFGSLEEGALVARSFTDLPRGCPSPARSGEMETLTEVRASPFGPAPAAALLQTYAFDGEAGTGATVVHVVPVGSALLVTSTFGQWTDDELEQAVAQTVEPLRQTVAAMQAFDGSSSEDGPQSATPHAVAIPSGFALAAGLPAGDEETEVSAPGPEYFDGRELLVHADADARGCRVGSARLMVSTYGEGSLASLEQQADEVTGTTEEIVPAMRTFTKTGC